MKHARFRPGDLVINAGRLAGYGYVWRVVRYLQHPEQLLEVVNIRPLHGKPERHDSHIGGTFQRLASELQPLPPRGAPIQIGLI